MLELSAGALSAVLDGPDIRQVKVAGHLALDMIYVTVRDAGWRTAPGDLIAMRQSDDGRLITWEVRHRLGDLSFRWHGEVELRPDRLTFAFEGVADSTFDANRIGLCLLHPQSLRGRTLRVGGPHGQRSGVFPTAISPHQPFVDLDRMSYAVSDNDELWIDLSGDLFEMEDHRNWSDPGWKTYCTPLARPAPVRYRPGQQVRQSIELTAVIGSPTDKTPTSVAAGAISVPRSTGSVIRSDSVRLQVGVESSRPLPVLGLGASDLTDAGQAERSLRNLFATGRPGYLHVELEYGSDWQRRLARATAEADTFGLSVDVALVADPGDLAPMATAVGALGERLHRVSVFTPDRHITVPGTVAKIRGLLADVSRSAQFGGGSRANLAELNRGHFDCANWDFVTYGLNPTVHHADDRSIMSTISAISDGLAQSSRVAGGLPVVVGPVTLRPRFNAYTGAADPLPGSLGSAADIDPRQTEDIAGVYLAGAITELTGAQAITAYRVVGPRGIVSTSGTPSPAAVVFTAFAELAGWSACPVVSSSEDLVAVAAHLAGDATVIVTNPGETSRRAEFTNARIVSTELLVGQSPAGRPGRPDPCSDFEAPARSVIRLVVRRGRST